MDILITESDLRQYLETNANLQTITDALCESGPTVDRVKNLSDDKLLEIEVITNRIDCASVFGIAREANTILTQKGITSKIKNDPYLATDLVSHQTQKINLKIEDEKTVYQFLAICLDGVSIKDSDQKTQRTLEAVGQRPINNLVDLTNLFTYLYGYPSHIFDKDKIDLRQLTLRSAKKGESIKLLDDSKLSLQEGDLVIEDGSGNLIDLCCVMGGKHAVVDEHTKNILLIIPTCDPKQVRKTSLTHQKRTLAAQIFEKKPDLSLAPKVLSLLTKSIIDQTGGHLSSDYLHVENQKPTQKSVKLNLNWLNKFVGQEINSNTVCHILENLGFKVKIIDNHNLEANIPSFRADDINNQEDLAEEITRIYGFHNIKAVFPALVSATLPDDPIYKLEKKIREVLSTLGYFETLNSSLISEKQIQDSNQNPNEFLKLKNALSEDLVYLRRQLGLSALQNHQNNKGKNIELKFFEIGITYEPKEPRPEETPYLCVSSENILELKQTLNHLFGLLALSNQINLSLSKEPAVFLNKQNTYTLTNQDTVVGYIGLTNSQTTIKNNLEKPIALAEINLKLLSEMTPKVLYQEAGLYPEIIEDINITSKQNLAEIHSHLCNNPLVSKVIYLDSFNDKHTFRIHFVSKTKNLTHEEVDQIKKDLLSKFS